MINISLIIFLVLKNIKISWLKYFQIKYIKQLNDKNNLLQEKLCKNQ